MEVLLLVGKVLFSYLFVTSGINHFKNFTAMAAYARYKNLFMADLGVLVSGVVLIVAPVLFVLGVAEVLMLYLIAGFLTMTAFIFHAYWKETDPQQKMAEMLTFNKEISLIGAALALIALI